MVQLIPLHPDTPSSLGLFKSRLYLVLEAAAACCHCWQLYRPLNMYVALVGVEIWIERDKIEIVNNADTTMNNFLEYRRNHISPKHRNDNAQLITSVQRSSLLVVDPTLAVAKDLGWAFSCCCDFLGFSCITSFLF